MVAIVEPEIAENTVPATTATTESRPGTRQMRRSMASIAFIATPVWNRTSPISTKNGIGVSEKLAIDATPLRIICTSPASLPSQIHAPTTLMPKKANAAGRPTANSAVKAPNRTAAESHQTIG